jgi:hypothetical protein
MDGEGRHRTLKGVLEEFNLVLSGSMSELVILMTCHTYAIVPRCWWRSPTR